METNTGVLRRKRNHVIPAYDDVFTDRACNFLVRLSTVKIDVVARLSESVISWTVRGVIRPQLVLSISHLLALILSV